MTMMLRYVVDVWKTLGYWFLNIYLAPWVGLYVLLIPIVPFTTKKSNTLSRILVTKENKCFLILDILMEVLEC